MRDGDSVATPLIVDSPGRARALIEHLRRLVELRDPHLVPVRGVEQRDGAIRVLAAPDEGIAFEELLVGPALSLLEATAIGIDVLEGLVALRRAGLSHGSLDAGCVYVGRDGRARLGGYALRPRWRPGSDRPVWPDPRGDVMAAGTLICAALGISRSASAGELGESERLAPGLTAVARSLASGRQGRNAEAALAALRSAAGALAQPTLLRRARQQLGARSGGPAVEPVVVAPAAVPPAPAVERRPEPPAAAPPVAAPPLRGRPLWWVAIGLVTAIVTGVVVYGAVQQDQHAAASHRRASVAAPTTKPSPPGPTVEPATPAPTQGDAEEDRSATDAVATFYRLVGQHRYDDAARLWSDRMRESYPPAENIDQRFADTSSLRLLRDEQSSSDDDRATVAIDLIEVRAGRTYHWVGTWYLVRGPSGWLLDQPALRSA